MECVGRRYGHYTERFKMIDDGARALSADELEARALAMAPLMQNSAWTPRYADGMRNAYQFPEVPAVDIAPAKPGLWSRVVKFLC